MNAQQLETVIVRPMQEPEAVQTEDTLEAFQKAVGGPIEMVFPFEDNAAIVCNEEGKLAGLMPNRYLYAKDGTPYDLLVGDFLIVGLEGDGFCSLTEKQKEVYIRQFAVEKCRANA